jgi:hypothetical protein
MKALFASVFVLGLLGASVSSADALTISVGGDHHGHRHCTGWGWHAHHHRYCRGWGW